MSNTKTHTLSFPWVSQAFTVHIEGDDEYPKHRWWRRKIIFLKWCNFQIVRWPGKKTVWYRYLSFITNILYKLFKYLLFVVIIYNVAISAIIVGTLFIDAEFFAKVRYRIRNLCKYRNYAFVCDKFNIFYTN